MSACLFHVEFLLKYIALLRNTERYKITLSPL